MKIAVVTNDGKNISQHFGRAAYYAIYTIENNEIVDSQMRQRHTGHNAQNNEHSHEHSHDTSQMHGVGQNDKHDAMAAEISDCQVLIAGGMGRGAYIRMFENGINVIMTDETNIHEAINKYINGKLTNLYIERTH